VLWVLGTGAQWRELPEKYPPSQTCHRRFQQWVRSGKFEQALAVLARYLHDRGQLNLDEAFVDAMLRSRKNGLCRRSHPARQGHEDRRYRRRWKVERLFAWMHNFRRLVTRWEYHIENFLGFVYLACLQMMLRHL